jgi:phosphoesterase RecJ-like protein
MSTQTPLLSPLLPAPLIQQAMSLIEPAQHIVLLAHEHPDGDCLGSALGLAHILRQTGKTCVAACADAAPQAFHFMPGIETLQHSLGDEHFDLVIALDAGELTRYGSLYEQHRAFLNSTTILNIDHHISSQGCGQVNIIDPTAASTTELIVLLQRQAGLPLNREAAVCLLTGLITDTGSFQYTSTTARTMEAGAILLRAGAIAEQIVKPIFRTRSLAQARFQAAVINNAQTSPDGRLIWSYATAETLASTGVTRDIDDNFSGLLRDIAGVEIAAFFRNFDDPNETRVSLRSNTPYDVARICIGLGGGGHPCAAGATVRLPLHDTMALVVAEMEHELQKQSQLY